MKAFQFKRFGGPDALLAALVGLIVAAVAIFPWTPGFTASLGGTTISAHTIGDLGGGLLAAAALAMGAAAWWGKTRFAWLDRLDEDFLNTWDSLLPWGMALAYFTIAGSLKLRQHQLLQTHGGDMGIFAAITWNTLHGRLFWSPYHGVSFLAIHADLVYALLAPVFLFTKRPEVLLLIQSAALALSLPAVYFLTRNITAKRTLALSAMLLFAGNPFILGMSQFDFHAEPLSIPLFLWAIVAQRRNRPWPFWLLVLAALTIKEDIGLVLAAWGVYFLLYEKGRWGLGAACCLIGLSFFAFDTEVIIKSHLPPGTAHHMISRYAHLGKTYPEIFMNLLNPAKLGPALLTPWQKPWALFRLLGSLLFLPSFESTACLPAAVAVLPHLLSNYDGQYMLTGSYACTAFPFLFFAMALGMRRLGFDADSDRRRKCLAAALLAAGLGMIFSPRFVEHAEAATPERLGSAERLFKLVPEGASVRAQSALYPHLCLREHIQSFPFGPKENDEFTSLQNPDYIALDLIGDDFPFTHEHYLLAVQHLAAGGDYEKVFDENGFQLWKRKVPGTPVYLAQRNWAAEEKEEERRAMPDASLVKSPR